MLAMSTTAFADSKNLPATPLPCEWMKAGHSTLTLLVMAAGGMRGDAKDARCHVCSPSFVRKYPSCLKEMHLRAQRHSTDRVQTSPRLFTIDRIVPTQVTTNHAMRPTGILLARSLWKGASKDEGVGAPETNFCSRSAHRPVRTPPPFRIEPPCHWPRD